MAESRFGHRFENVRVHVDDVAARSADAVAAEAYAVGRHVVFGAHRFAPRTQHGLHLIMHELAHVVQQDSSQIPSRLLVSQANDPAERAADHSSNRGSLVSSTAVVARQGLGEMFGAVRGVGPYDAWKARGLANEALSMAQNSGLPGLHNGAADAYRHCYWNCRMAAELGADQAETVANGHERHGGGPANENTMDLSNNVVGRACSVDCDTCCRTELSSGNLRVIDSTGTVVPSSSPGATATTPGAYRY